MTSDIDIFVYGLSPKEAIKKIEKIYEVIQENNQHRVLIIRTPQAVTFASQFPCRFGEFSDAIQFQTHTDCIEVLQEPSGDSNGI